MSEQLIDQKTETTQVLKKPTNHAINVTIVAADLVSSAIEESSGIVG